MANEKLLRKLKVVIELFPSKQQSYTRDLWPHIQYCRTLHSVQSNENEAILYSEHLYHKKRASQSGMGAKNAHKQALG